MGVHGLTTFVKENRRSLSYTLELKSDDFHKHSKGVNIVVDGWSLIYAVFNNSGEPWVYGGEPAALARHVENIVSSWTSVGIKPVFVFDGPVPLLKYSTVISRLQNNCVKPANLFFRTSSAARSTPRSLAETRIAPPLGYQAIVSTLLCMGPDVKVEFADGEADPYIVALAGQLGAYVMGSDSDFLVLNCEGYKGYIPLEETIWIASAKDPNIHPSDSSAVGEDDDFEFQIVTKKKQKGKLKAQESRMELGTVFLPPLLPTDSEVTLLLTVYEPTTFAQHVSLPPSLLPLLGALIGNDYASFEFFRFTESAALRVKRVADTLSAVLKEAQSGNAKKIRKVSRGGQGGVMDIIGTTVERLLLWRDPANPPASGQIDKITEMVVQSTLEYAMNTPTSLLQEPLDNSEIDGLGVGHGTVDAAGQVRNLYLHAYREGTLQPKIVEIFIRGSCFPRLFLEDPDRECCTRSIGQPIREVIWSVLADGGGIPERSDASNEESSDNAIQSGLVEDDDELVDVVEELSDDAVSAEDEDDDDPLAALRGKLQRLSFSGADETPETTNLPHPVAENQRTPTGFVDVVKPSPKVVTDYIRRGARVVGEDLVVRQLCQFLPETSQTTGPIQLRPKEERLSVFLQALGSDTSSIRKIAAEETGNLSNLPRGGKLLAVVALRWVLKTLHARAEAVEEGSRRRDRNKEKWTRSEAQAFLASLYDEEKSVEDPSIEDRAVQLTAQALAALEACGWLAQSLLLVELPGARNTVEKATLPVVLGEFEKMFSGRRFHAALGRSRPSTGNAFNQLWSAVEDDLGDIFGEEKGKKGKRERKASSDVGVSSANKAPAGMFAVLAGLEVQ